MCPKGIGVRQAAVIFVTIGVVTATLSKPAPPRIPFRHGASPPLPADSPDRFLYVVGVGMMALGLVLSAVLGATQEKTFEKFGPHWHEGVFYTVSLGDDHVILIIIYSTSMPSASRYSPSFFPRFSAVSRIHSHILPPSASPPSPLL